MQAEVDATQDTEFHDALRAHGIIPPKPPSRSPSPELPSAGEMRTQALKQATVDDLDLELEGELDDEEQKLLEKIRRQRMSQLRAETKKARFGRVYPISRPDYTREVTEASKQDPDADPDSHFNDDEGREADSASKADKQRQGGTGVVCFLYKTALTHVVSSPATSTLSPPNIPLPSLSASSAINASQTIPIATSPRCSSTATASCIVKS